MIKVTLDGTEFQFFWQYGNGRRPSYKGIAARVKTTCCYLRVNQEILGSAEVVKHYKDTENRDKARRYALDKLLKNRKTFTRAARTQIWTAYNAMVHMDKKEVTT